MSDIYLYITKNFMWTKTEINHLIDLYPTNKNVNIANILNKSTSSVENKAYRLSLKKDIKYLKDSKSLLLTNFNKKNGRDLTDALLAENALKYKTRSDFQRGDASAYATARIRGVLNDICRHMVMNSFSLPQLILRDIMDGLLNLKGQYNTRSVIKPYEIDIYYPTIKLGFEYQGRYWHLSNKRDNIKNKLLTDMGINIVYIFENNKKYAEDIKLQIINNLPIINKTANILLTNKDVLNYTIGDVYSTIYHKKDLINVAKSYATFKEFIVSERKVYVKLHRLKLIDIATSHMKDRLRRRNITEVTEIIKQYKTIHDLIKFDWGTYQYVKRNKLNNLINHLK